MYRLSMFFKAAAVISLVTSCSDFSKSDSSGVKASNKIERIWASVSNDFQVTGIDQSSYLFQDNSSCKNTTEIFRKKAAEELHYWYKIEASWLDGEGGDEPYVENTMGIPEAVEDASNVDFGSKSSEYSDTNNQVAGVEEADVLKTDGHYIFLASYGSEINVMTKDHKLIKRFKLGAALHSKAQLVLGKNKTIFAVIDDNKKTRVYKIDYQNESKVTSKLISEFHGFREAIRKVDDKLYLVLSEHFEGISEFSAFNHSDLNSSNIAAYFKNDLKKLKEMNLGELLGVSDESVKRICSKMYVQGHYSTTNESSSGLGRDSGFGFYNRARYGLTKVIGIDLVTQAVSESGVAKIVDHVYMNKSSLYLANANYEDSTLFHKFSLDGEISYRGSGEIDGRVLNQFSMDEYKGVLRVAVTKRGSGPSVNQVLTIAEAEDKKLEIIGETENLAKGERIYSVRFNGEKGYVVTFREIDPLFTLDLQDPKSPEVLGELKIPGFSTYMHLIGDEKILAIGDSGSGNVKLSLFDVSDMAAPAEIDNLIIEDSHYSEAQFNHLAFNYYAPLKKLAVPFYVSSGKNDIKVFDIDDTISEAGSFGVSNCRYWDNSVRSLFIGDRIYGVSSRELVSVAVDNISNSEGYVIGNVIGECARNEEIYWDQTF